MSSPAGRAKDAVPLISRPGRSCWQIARAGRLAILVDGETYFAALARACAKAEETILILGWDVDAHARVNRVVEGLPEELGAFLIALAHRRRDLRVRVLAWDGSVVFGIDRRLFEIFGLGPFPGLGSRVDFQLDGERPVAGCHHQKLVIVDDRLAFIGGIDVTTGRWDTRAHAADDPGRVEAGVAHGPYHDMQAVLDGAAAQAISALARERWHRATGRQLGKALRSRARDRMRHVLGRSTPPAAVADRWPDGVEPDLKNLDVAIARTDANDLERAEIREIEALYVDAIAAARQSVYIETQYFTAPQISQAIGKRLAEPEGPEIVLVMPEHCAGWLEENTMGVLRARLLRQLLEADAGRGRLRALFPRVPGNASLHLHSKLLIVDDALLHVGSANMAKRSMSLDTECGITVEAAGREDVASVIRALRTGLVAEHLGVEAQVVEREIAARHSLIATLDALHGNGPRTLEHLPLEQPAWLDALTPALNLADPERPPKDESVRRELARARSARWTPGALIRGGLVVLALLVLPIAWTQVPGGIAGGSRALADLLEPVHASPIGPLIVIAAYVIGGLVAIPVTLLALATVLLYGPFAGSLLALVAALASAMTGYTLGRVAGRPILKRMRQRGLERLSHALGRQGLFASALMRIIPIAPFTLVNVLAGSAGVRSWDFFVGTFLGLIPGIIAGAVFSDAVAHPGKRSLVQLLAFAVMAGLLFAWARWRWRRGVGGSSLR